MQDESYWNSPPPPFLEIQRSFSPSQFLQREQSNSHKQNQQSSKFKSDLAILNLPAKPPKKPIKGNTLKDKNFRLAPIVKPNGEANQSCYLEDNIYGPTINFDNLDMSYINKEVLESGRLSMDELPPGKALRVLTQLSNQKSLSLNSNEVKSRSRRSRSPQLSEQYDELPLVAIESMSKASNARS